MSDKTEHPPVPEAFAALGVRLDPPRPGRGEIHHAVGDSVAADPRALAGVDILGQARTGTGKTAAFGIPILQQVRQGRGHAGDHPRPHARAGRAGGRGDQAARPVHADPHRSPVYGGQKIAAQMKFLKHGPEILVGTPGRVIDLLDRRIIDFDNIRFVVLDEVDRMLDIGFRDDIRNILSRVKGVDGAPMRGATSR